VLHVSGLGNAEEPKKSTIDRVSKELDNAFVNIGFVYLKNHGIDNPTVSLDVLFPSLTGITTN
jgi:isopenicillin N synthase-like dioxygenase